jgi:hypothetical protein
VVGKRNAQNMHSFGRTTSRDKSACAKLKSNLKNNIKEKFETYGEPVWIEFNPLKPDIHINNEEYYLPGCDDV